MVNELYGADAPLFEIVIKIGRLQSILILYNQFMPVLFSINDLTS